MDRAIQPAPHTTLADAAHTALSMIRQALAQISELIARRRTERGQMPPPVTDGVNLTRP